MPVRVLSEMRKGARILRLVLQEAILPVDLSRIPEPTAEMNSSESIRGFHAEGKKSLLPIYHFSALAINALAPLGSHVFDLGCGTGLALMYLAAHRPDIQITGIDFADGMITTGRDELARSGLDRRVNLLQGDMRNFANMVPESINVISSVFALHHLTTHTDLMACVREIAKVAASHHAHVWIFDHARPSRRRTAEEVPKVFTPTANDAFREDSKNSLCAAWSFEELDKALSNAFSANLRGALSRILPLYQIHWLPLSTSNTGAEWFPGDPLPPGAANDARVLTSLFSTAPQKTGNG